MHIEIQMYILLVAQVKSENGQSYDAIVSAIKTVLTHVDAIAPYITASLLIYV